MKTANEQPTPATALDWLTANLTAAINAPADHLAFIALGSAALIVTLMALSRILGFVLNVAVVGQSTPLYGTSSSGGLLNTAPVKVGFFIFIVGLVQGTFQPFVIEFLQVVAEVTGAGGGQL